MATALRDMASDGDWAARFQAAALEPHLWEDALRTLAQATGSNHAQLIGLGGPAVTPFNWVTDVAPDMVGQFTRIEQGSPTVNFRIAADLLPDLPAIVHESHYAVARPSLKSEDYLDLCSDHGIPLGCQTRLVQDGRSLIGFALLRSDANGATTIEQRRLFARVAEHARTAVRLQAAIEHQGFGMINGSMEAMARACFLLDGPGQIGAMTSRAEHMLRRTRLRVTDRRLTSTHAADARAIDRALRALFADGATPAPLLLQTADGGGMPSLMLEFYRLPRRDWALHFAPRAIVVAREPEAPRAQGAATLIAAFGLTPAEADVALMLAQGLTREAIAAGRGVAAETLKAQIRNLYGKTGCSRESELVRLVTFLAG